VRGRASSSAERAQARAGIDPSASKLGDQRRCERILGVRHFGQLTSASRKDRLPILAKTLFQWQQLEKITHSLHQRVNMLSTSVTSALNHPQLQRFTTCTTTRSATAIPTTCRQPCCLTANSSTTLLQLIFSRSTLCWAQLHGLQHPLAKLLHCPRLPEGFWQSLVST